MFHNKKFYVGLCIFSSSLFAKTHISKQYPCTPETLKKIEFKIQHAFERPEEMQEYMTYYSIDEDKNIALACGPHLPDKEGKGCLLHFSIKLESNSSIGISKKVFMKGKSQEVEDKLKKVDPNTTEDHQHFGSIFESQETFGSHYFCQPEGKQGNKVWGCYLG